MRYLRTGQNNVVDFGPAVIGTTGGTLVSPTTGLTAATVDEIGVYKHGATALTSSTAQAITHRAGGMYTMTFSTDLVDTLGRLTFYCRDDSACLPIRHEFMVLPANVYDSWVGTDRQQVDVMQIRGSSDAAIGLHDLHRYNHRGGVAAAAAGTITLSTSAVRTANYYRGGYAVAYSTVPGQLQSRLILSGTTALVQTISPNWTTNPTTAYTVQILPVAPGVSATTGLPDVNLRALSGSTQSATDLQDFADAGYDPANNVVLSDLRRINSSTSRLLDWNAAWDAEVQSEVTDALVAANLDHVALTATTVALDVGTYLGRVMHASTAGTYDRTTDSLEAIRNRGDAAWTGGTTLSAASVADAVWDEAQAAHVGAGSFGLIATEIADILVDTAEIGAAGAGLTALGGMSTGMRAQVQTEANDALIANNLDHVALTGTTTAPAAGTYLGRVMHASTAGTYDRTTDSLEAIRNTAPLGTTMRGTDSAFLAASAPTNIGALGISTAGAITTVTTLTNRTGFALGSTGMNAVTLAEPTTVPAWGTVTAPQGLAWNLAFNRNRLISNTTEITLRNDANNADIATAAVTATTSQVIRGEYST